MRVDAHVGRQRGAAPADSAKWTPVGPGVGPFQKAVKGANMAVAARPRAHRRPLTFRRAMLSRRAPLGGARWPARGVAGAAARRHAAPCPLEGPRTATRTARTSRMTSRVVWSECALRGPGALWAAASVAERRRGGAAVMEAECRRGVDGPRGRGPATNTPPIVGRPDGLASWTPWRARRRR